VPNAILLLCTLFIKTSTGYNFHTRGPIQIHDTSFQSSQLKDLFDYFLVVDQMVKNTVGLKP
jgi:hypothetical protein